MGAESASWYPAEPRCSLELVDALPVAPSQSVIDIGGGASTLVDALLRRRFTDVTVLDVSPVALEQASRRLGEQARQVRWLAQDVLRWRPPRRFDGWHDRAVFHFLVREADRQRYLDVLRAGVRLLLLAADQDALAEG